MVLQPSCPTRTQLVTPQDWPCPVVCCTKPSPAVIYSNPTFTIRTLPLSSTFAVPSRKGWCVLKRRYVTCHRAMPLHCTLPNLPPAAQCAPTTIHPTCIHEPEQSTLSVSLSLPSMQAVQKAAQDAAAARAREARLGLGLGLGRTCTRGPRVALIPTNPTHRR